MRKIVKKIAVIMIFALIGSILPANISMAANKVKLSAKNLTITAGKTKTLKLKNNRKSVKWTVISGKKYVQLKNKKKTSVKIVAKKKGTAKVQAKVGKKKYVCKVTVKKSQKSTNSSSSGTTTTTVPTTKPTTQEALGEQLKSKLNIDIKLLQSGNVLFTVTNKSNKFIKDVSYNLGFYNENGTYVDDFSIHVKYLRANGGQSYDVWSQKNLPENCDLSKTKVKEIIVDYDAACIDRTTYVTSSLQKINDNKEMKFTLKNSSSQKVYYTFVMLYFDANDKLIDANDGSTCFNPFELDSYGTDGDSVYVARNVYSQEFMQWSEACFYYSASSKF